ncbi:Hsp33 family molecular chaperone HslO [Brachymonas sp. G13]|uniref:Hsp33 family molecular chaperone HslO n=1 Tax=Brachymonas TaxID=28219 RepID=UPI001691C1E5|nr:Hsp33 family molecular chaperone HslO [Brachymonas sp. J145]MEE1654434.1 Hsp33 family molecular chaperone HslO [Brachymonas sp. J145]NLX15755.1 Hsp33 family molecular chaperone HslO [Ramlibacter sp.]
MSQIQKFLFDGIPVRGVAVRLTDAWQEVVQRRAANTQSGPYPASVNHLLGEMTAAAMLMQSNIKFNGALILQVQGDGPVKVAVAEVQPSLGLRATASIVGEVAEDAGMTELVNLHGQGQCAITLDPRDRLPGQQPYQGVVPLKDSTGQPFARVADMLRHYMRQSEQLDTTLVLAANEQVAAGLLIQRLPLEGEANLAGSTAAPSDEARAEADESYNHIATLAQSLKEEELLELDLDTILHRLFWNEKLLRFVPAETDPVPHFACTCSQQRVANMVRTLGQEEAESILEDHGEIEVGCEFCGQQYHFDKVEVAQLFTSAAQQPPASDKLQ